MKICIVSFDYPDSKRDIFPFVKQLVCEFANQGHDCYVIAPYSISKNRLKDKEDNVYTKINNGSVTVLRPSYISTSNLHIGKFYLTDFLHKRAVERAFKKLPKDIDCIYAHFWKSAIEVAPYAIRNNIPLFIATGESEIPESSVSKSYDKYYKYISGVICVSSKNRDESISKGLTTIDKCIVVPNAINNKVFHLMDKTQCRDELNLPHNAFIVTTIGWFSKRKGTKILSNALDKLSDSDIHSIFIGKGSDTPDCNNILYKGTVAHHEIPKYLNASDVFVLPTLKEGCCNAIIEAMACGLPIISSDLSFNHDILDQSNSILIDPTNEDEIANAIKHLKQDSDLLYNLSQQSLNTANNLTIDNRASTIIQFIRQRVNK